MFVLCCTFLTPVSNSLCWMWLSWLLPSSRLWRQKLKVSLDKTTDWRSKHHHDEVEFCFFNSNYEATLHAQSAELRPIVTQCFSGLCLYCLSVGWFQPWALQKQLNQSRCHFGYGLRWAQGNTYYVGALWIICGHTQTCLQSIFSPLFAGGSSDAASGYLYCSNLLCNVISSRRIVFTVTWSQHWHSSWRSTACATLTSRRYPSSTTECISTSARPRWAVYQRL